MGSNFLIELRALLIGVLATVACQAVAEPVAVRGVERGQGYIFGHDGHCYLVTARHVSGDRPRVQVIAEGAVSGSVSLRFPFWSGIDLAVGVVRRGAAERCNGSLNELGGKDRQTGASAGTFLVLVDDEGLIDRLEMVIIETRYLDLDAKFVGGTGAATARQGMSGGFLFANGRPVGMAIESLDGETIRFIRTEEIHQNVSRWIGTQGAIRPDGQESATGLGQTGLPLLVASTNATAIGAEFLPENILTEGPAYVFAPTRNAEIVFEVATEERATLSRVILNATPEAGNAIPRRLVIFASPDAEGSTWRTFWSGEMSRDGVLDTGPRAQTWARRIKIVIASVWSDGPIKVDQVFAR